MTLDEVKRMYCWSSAHEYESHATRGGKIVTIYGLGMWEVDLNHVLRLIPGLHVTIRGRVHHPDADWLRVDIDEITAPTDG